MKCVSSRSSRRIFGRSFPGSVNRESEIRRLIQLVVLYRAVLLYSDSGIGKSSVLNAGLIPALIKEGFQPEIIRVKSKKNEEIIIERIRESEDKPSAVLPSIFSSKKSAEPVILSVEKFQEIVEQHSKSAHPLLIFDQFEEWVTRFEGCSRAGTENEAFETKEKILETMVGLINDTVLPIKIVIAFREEYLAKFTPFFRKCPNLSDQFLRLKPFTDEQIYRIVRGPFEDVKCKGRYKYELDAALAKEIQEQFIERNKASEIQLTEVQIVCKKLFERAKEGKNPTQYFHENGGVKGILEKYMDEVLDLLDKEQQDPAIGLMNRMITSSRTRNVISRDDLIERVVSEDGISRDLLNKTLDNLGKSRNFIRSAPHRDVYYYQLTSEFLIDWIKEKNKERQRKIDQKKIKEKEERLRIEQQAKGARRFKRLSVILSLTLAVLTLTLAVLTFSLIDIKKSREKEKQMHAKMTQRNKVSGLLKDSEISLYKKDTTRALNTLQAARDTLQNADSVLALVIKQSLGKIYADQREYPLAIDEFESAIKLNPNCGDAHAMLGVIYTRQGKYNEAVQELNTAIQLNPNDAWTHEMLGDALKGKKDISGSVKSYLRAINLDSSRSKTHKSLGETYRSMKQYEKATYELKKSTESDPTNASNFNTYGDALFEQKKYDDAQAAYLKAITLQPGYSSAHASLGKIYLIKGQHEQALAEIKKAVEMDTADAMNYTILGDFYFTDNPDSAAIEYEIAIKKNPNLHEAHAKLAFIYSQRKHLFKQAFSHSGTAYAIQPGNVSYRSNYIAYAFLAEKDRFAYDMAGKMLYLRGLDPDIRLNMRFIRFACAAMRNLKGEKIELQNFANDYSKLPAGYTTHLSWDGAKYYLANTEKLRPECKKLLLLMIDLLLKEKSAESINDFNSIVPVEYKSIAVVH
jgi:tetratricopeptide (TPR) repeat protein